VIFETYFRVLVVEDEALISMLIEDMLADIGCKCVDVAASVEGAMEALARAAPDFAMLDINLNGKRSFAIADILLSREIPFVFLSGYGSRELGEAYAGAKVLQKPFQLGDIEAVLADVFGSARTGACLASRDGALA
jgi:CheY-like chemotaxis protein